MNIDPSDSFAALSVKLSTILGGAIGGFISMRFHDGLTTVQKWITFFGGWGLGAFLGLPLISALEIKPVWEVGISLMIGLFGMSLTAAIINATKVFDWAGTAQNILDRFFGGRK